jgi:hypothetical protein
MEYKAIAVCDLAEVNLTIYDVFEHWDNEDIENFLIGKGHHLSDCSWAEFDGEINDTRKDYDTEGS